MTECKECRHIMPSGLHCKSPAMRGSVFCYFHGRPPRPSRPARAPETNLEIPPVIGSRGCALALNQIMQALANNRISSRRAAVLLQAVQMASGQSSAGSADFAAALSNFPRPGSQPGPNRRKE